LRAAFLRAWGVIKQRLNTGANLGCYATVIPDRHSRAGPLGGLEAALYSSDTDLNLFLPVDLPLLPDWFLPVLLGRARMTDALATIPLVNGLPQPLVAVYRRSMRSLLEEAIGRKEYKVTRAIYKAKNLPGGVDFFHVEMLPRGDGLWPYLWFRNVNFPQNLVLC
jgi:molybdenum cofactor guanylyltransferase